MPVFLQVSLNFSKVLLNCALTGQKNQGTFATLYKTSMELLANLNVFAQHQRFRRKSNFDMTKCCGFGSKKAKGLKKATNEELFCFEELEIISGGLKAGAFDVPQILNFFAYKVKILAFSFR